MSDSAGQATAVSIVVGIRRLGRSWYRLLFFLARHVRYITAPMRRQAFIHFCHWMVLTDVPNEDGGRSRLPRPVLWFESNYDGDVTRYMDTFARTIPWRMRAAWMPTRGFPDVFPSGPFHEWTVDNAFEASHYSGRVPLGDDQGRRPRPARAWRGGRPSPSDRGGATGVGRRALDGIPRSYATRLVNCIQLSILAAVLDGHRDALRTVLAGLPTEHASPFARVAGTHNGRWVVLDTAASPDAPRRVGGVPRPMLMCSAVIDRSAEEWLSNLLEELGGDADRIWGHCVGWPVGANRVSFLLEHRVQPSLAFATWNAPVDEVREALALHARMSALAVRSRGMTAAQLHAALDEALAP